MKRLGAAIAASMLLLAAAPAPIVRVADPLTAAVADLCPKQVALLGENGEHGSGTTLAFKAALVERLIMHCGYRAVLFEANRYQFIAFERTVMAGTADEAGLRAAVGDLWGRYAEFAPLGAFLTAQAKAGRVRLAGLDDGVGVRHATFANDTMIGELTGLLPTERGNACARRLRSRVDWDGSSASYGATERRELGACVAAIRDVVRQGSDQAALVAALQRLLDRDLQPAAVTFAGRERSMHAAFGEVMATLPPRTKVIVWGATAHLARDSRTWPALPNAPSLGALVHQRYGERAFTLGFSALGGTWRRSPSLPETPWSPAPADALELRALREGAGSGYLGRRALRRSGRIPARMWNDAFVRANWGGVVDGLVVFRTDRPPTLRR